MEYRIWMLIRVSCVVILGALLLGCGDDDCPSCPAGDPADTASPQVAVTSHTDGQQITGSRTITLEGTLADDSTIANVTVTLDGVEQPSFFTQSGFLCILDLADGNNAIAVTAEDASGNASSAQITLTYLAGIPVVTVTSHADGDRVTGSREVSLSGALADDSTIVSVTVTLNGADQLAFFNQASFTSILTVENGDNAVIVTATDIHGNSGTASLNLYFPFLTLSDHAAADTVIGQALFNATSPDRGGSPAADTLDGPFGDPSDYNGMLYVVDTNNHRILGFDQVPVTNGPAADFVIGQPDFTTTSPSSQADGAYYPQTVREYDDKLFVSNYSSNSIYIYNSVPTTTGAAAGVVVGQTDFGIGASGCSASSLNGPESFIVAGGKLIVADSGNNRVLVWSSIPATNGEPADLVLGQSDFTSCLSALSPSRMNYPTDVWTDGTRLLVVDSGNHRVLLWNSFPTSDGQSADLVMGESALDDSVPGVSDRDLSTPYFVASNGNQIFLCDLDNNRVLVWDTWPTMNFAPADRVIGQSDFLNNAADDNDGDGFSDASAGAKGLDEPGGVHVTDDALFVVDNRNNRVLIFRPTP
jgi:hypothetical protein